MDLNKFAHEVHENSLTHGWWSTKEDKEMLNSISLIHAEWSEALEEFRAGRGMHWKRFGDQKPEGIAVELIDGCIRILDFMECVDAKTIDLDDGMERVPKWLMSMNLPQIVSVLHCECSVITNEVLSGKHGIIENRNGLMHLINAMFIALRWVKENGSDPEQLLREKHEYNKTRPYRHGGKVC